MYGYYSRAGYSGARTVGQNVQFFWPAYFYIHTLEFRIDVYFYFIFNILFSFLYVFFGTT